MTGAPNSRGIATEAGREASSAIVLLGDGRTLTHLRDLYLLRQQIEDWTGFLVGQLRADGVSWGEIGDALGITRQAAQQRYGH